jgi:TNF receptor-associated factor 2/TNF receptor-associated factor 3
MMLEQRTEQQERETSTLKVNVSELELQLQASLASTHNGSFLWRIPEVARRRRDAIDERITSIYSPPFYSGRNGYKMCIRAYLNGDGIGYKTHFSVFFVLMRGEFDPLLKWPFEYKVSLILVDQEHRKHIVQTFKPTPESSSFRRPTTDMNVASGPSLRPSLPPSSVLSVSPSLLPQFSPPLPPSSLSFPV